jgi:hypothetical protein
MHGGHWPLKTLRVDHEIAHSDLTAVPKKQMKHYDDLPLQIETIIRLHDHDREQLFHGFKNRPLILVLERR